MMLKLHSMSLAQINGILLSTVVVLIMVSYLSFDGLIYAQDESPMSGMETSNVTSQDQQESQLGLDFVTRGISSSDSGILPLREDIQSAVVLPPREDGAMYTGSITYLASRPVDIITWNILDPLNVTMSEDFGNRENVLSIQGLDLALSELETTSASGSVLFSGNALEFVSDDPFVVTYALKARADNTVQLNDVSNVTEVSENGEEQEN
jgi:hypothetical protein